MLHISTGSNTGWFWTADRNLNFYNYFVMYTRAVKGISRRIMYEETVLKTRVALFDDPG